MSLLLWLPLKKDGRNLGTFDTTVDVSNATFSNLSLSGGSVSAPFTLAPFYPTHTFTISFFCKVGSSSTGTLWRIGSSSSNHLRCSSTVRGLILSWGGYDQEVMLLSGADFTTFKDTKWHHVTIRVIANSEANWVAQCYLDGIAKTSTEYENTTILTNTTLNVRDGDFGSIRDFKIYDEALDDHQILRELDEPDLCFCNGEDISVNDYKITKISALAGADDVTHEETCGNGNNESTLYFGSKNYFTTDCTLPDDMDEFSVIANIYCSADTTQKSYSCLFDCGVYDCWLGVNSEQYAVWFFCDNYYMRCCYNEYISEGLHTIVLRFVRGTAQIWIDGVEQIVYHNGTTRTTLKVSSASSINNIRDGKRTHTPNDTVMLGKLKVYTYAISDKMIEEFGTTKPTISINSFASVANSIIGLPFKEASTCAIKNTGIDFCDASSIVIDKATASQYLPIMYQNFDIAENIWFPSSVDLSANYCYVNQTTWSKLHLLNPSNPKNIIGNLENGYEFMLLQEESSGIFSKYRWKQNVNPIGGSYANTAPSVITNIENMTYYMGGIYYANGSSRRLIQSNTTNGNSYGMMQTYDEYWVGQGNIPISNNLLRPRSTQILLVRVKADSSMMPNVHGIYKGGHMDFRSFIEIQ